MILIMEEFQDEFDVPPVDENEEVAEEGAVDVDEVVYGDDETEE